MTWRLWRAFKNPPSDHPLFKRMINETYEDQIELVSLLQRILIQGQVWLWPLLFMLNMRALILMIFSGTLYGAVWSIRISGMIAAERKNGRYDLLCLSPVGAVGVAWAICTGCLHQDKAFEQINSREAWSIRLILFIPVVISVPFIIRQFFSISLSTTFIGIIAVMLVFYLDHVQSILFGSLFGVMASYYAPNPLDQRLWAMAGFLSLQIASYLVPTVLVFLIFPMTYRYMNGWLIEASIPVVSVLSFYLPREIILTHLWNLLAKQLTGTPAELDFLFETAHKRTPGSYADSQIVARTP
jgi:hypothetical protein